MTDPTEIIEETLALIARKGNTIFLLNALLLEATQSMTTATVALVSAGNMHEAGKLVASAKHIAAMTKETLDDEARISREANERLKKLLEKR